MEKRSFFIIAIMLVMSAAVYSADDAYEIKVKIKNYKGNVCYLGYPYGDKKYLADTAQKMIRAYLYSLAVSRSMVDCTSYMPPLRLACILI